MAERGMGSNEDNLEARQVQRPPSQGSLLSHPGILGWPSPTAPQTKVPVTEGDVTVETRRPMAELDHRASGRGHSLDSVHSRDTASKNGSH